MNIDVYQSIIDRLTDETYLTWRVENPKELSKLRKWFDRMERNTVEDNDRAHEARRAGKPPKMFTRAQMLRRSGLTEKTWKQQQKAS